MVASFSLSCGPADTCMLEHTFCCVGSDSGIGTLTGIHSTIANSAEISTSYAQSSVRSDYMEVGLTISRNEDKYCHVYFM